MFLPSLLVTYILRFRFNLGFNNRGDVQSLNTTGNCGFTIVKLDPKLLRYCSIFFIFSLSSFLTNLILHGHLTKLATFPRPMFARYQDQFESTQRVNMVTIIPTPFNGLLVWQIFSFPALISNTFLFFFFLRISE